jgi:hypothetical protein
MTCSRPARKVRAYRPRLEVLEDRTLPSTFLVDHLADDPVGSGLTGSLRYAITNAADNDHITFGVTGTINLTGALPTLTHSIAIEGPGPDQLTVRRDTGGDYRIFTVAGGTTVNIIGLTVANGHVVSTGGGGLFNAGTLTITNSTLSGNAAIGVNAGGGIYNANPGMVTVSNSTFSGNAAFNGGGLFNAAGGTVTITSSTLSGNSAIGAATGVEAGGGGIQNAGTLTVTNSTFSGNSSGGFGGGGILNGGTLTVTNSTLRGNSAFGGGFAGGASGGGIRSGRSAVRNTIIAGNTAPAGPDFFGTLGSQGHNLIGDGTGGSAFDPTDLVGTSANPIDSMLGPLQDNGGPTLTMALMRGSPAIGAGDPTDAPDWDQRGPGFPRVVNGRIDIGAFQVQPVHLTVQCSVSTPVFWPPSHQLINVGLSVEVSDPNATLQVQVFANDGANSDDAADLAAGELRLRSARQGGGSGRVYLIVVTATDAAGNTAVSVCTVVVPHDHSPGSLAAVEQQATYAGDFYLAMHTAPPGYALLG